MRFDRYNDMRDFLNAILEQVEKLRAIGEHVKDPYVIAIMLCNLPSDYDPLITTLESKEEKDLTIEYVQSKLLDEAYRKDQHNDNDNNQAMPAYQRKIGYGFNTKIQCYECGQNGHMRRDCKWQKTRSNRTNWRDVEEMNNPIRGNNYGKGQNTIQHKQNSFVSNGCSNCASSSTINHSEEDDWEKSANKLDELALSGTTKGTEDTEGYWIVDSGASSHMSNKKEFFEQLHDAGEEVKITIADGKQVSSTQTGSGYIYILSNEGKIIKLKIENVLYVPELNYQLLSIKQLCQKGFHINFKETNCSILKNNQLIVTAKLQKGTFILNEIKPDNTSYAKACIHQWHLRLGHRNLPLLKIMCKNKLAKNFVIDNCKHGDFCSSCKLGKMSQNPFPSSINQTSKPFEIIVSDLYGPMSVDSLGGNKYAITITDVYSRYIEVEMLKYKSQATEKIQSYIRRGQNKFGYLPSILRTDGGGEYVNHNLDTFLDKNGIVHQTSVAYCQQQNGISERLNRSLITITRCMLKEKNLPLNLWGEAMNTAAYIINRVPHTATGVTPYQKWEGKLPILNHMKTFGSKAYAFTSGHIRNKLADTAVSGIMIGYGINKKGYRIWLPETSKIITAHTVHFEENEPSTTHNLPDTLNSYSEYYHQITDDDPNQIESGASNDFCNPPRRSLRLNKGVPAQKWTY